MEEPFDSSDDDEESAERRARRRQNLKPSLNLPIPRRRIRMNLSGTVPPTGYSPVWGGPTMCLGCLEFFDLPEQTPEYVKHLHEKHNIVITDIKLIVDVKRYVEHWRHRFGKEKIETIFPKTVPKDEDPLKGQVEFYYLMSPYVEEDRNLRQRLAMRRLEEVLSCQQREREDFTFSRSCLFCRYRARGNRSKIIHHLYMVHHLNLGSPDNLVFVNEYLDLLKGKLEKNQCLYCEKIFDDHQVLMEHMRKQKHREVNPKNSYYDRFYVINYLELGKKWLEVLAEDFEDCMPSFDDSDDEEQELESWAEWVEDNTDEDVSLVVCLFCDESFQKADDLVQHIKKLHEWDIGDVMYGEGSGGRLTFYERIKVFNYIRKQNYTMNCSVCGLEDLRSWEALRKHLSACPSIDKFTIPPKMKWDKDEFLVPVFENDHLLWILESHFDTHNGEEDERETTTAVMNKNSQAASSSISYSSSTSAHKSSSSDAAAARNSNRKSLAVASESTKQQQDPDSTLTDEEDLLGSNGGGGQENGLGKPEKTEGIVYAEDMPELASVLADPDLRDQLV